MGRKPNKECKTEEKKGQNEASDPTMSRTRTTPLVFLFTSQQNVLFFFYLL